MPNYKDPPMNMDERRKRLEQLRFRDRDPFTEILAEVLEAKPDMERMKQWAYDHPDKWTQMVQSMSKLAGYADRTESLNMSMDLTRLSDMELQTRLQEMLQDKQTRGKILALMPVGRVPKPITIEGVVEEVKGE